jgi:hypothetical protein
VIKFCLFRNPDVYPVRASKILYVPVAGTRTRVLVHMNVVLVVACARKRVTLLLREKILYQPTSSQYSCTGTHARKWFYYYYSESVACLFYYYYTVIHTNSSMEQQQQHTQALGKLYLSEY